MLLSTAYYPSLEYMALCVQASSITLEAHEHFVKQTYRNRTHIASANGMLALTVPISKPQGSKTPIKEVEIQYAETWNKQHAHAIVSAYNSSPYFEYYADEILSIFEKKYRFLWDMNTDIFQNICTMLGIEIQISESQEFTPIETIENDYRYKISPKNSPISHTPPYYQVFADKHGFIPHLSCIDLLCNMGPEAVSYLYSYPLK